jgi:hypothetical protein
MSLTDKYQEMLGIQPIWGARDALKLSPSSSRPGKSAKRVFALDVPAIHVFLV